MQFHTLALLLCLSDFPRLLTESKQAEFFHMARILIQLEKYDDFVSILEKDIAVYGHICKYTNPLG